MARCRVGSRRPRSWSPRCLVGAGSIAGDELEGGPLAIPLLLGYLGLLLWIVWACVVLWRGARGAGPARPSARVALAAAVDRDRQLQRHLVAGWDLGLELFD